MVERHSCPILLMVCVFAVLAVPTCCQSRKRTIATRKHDDFSHDDFSLQRGLMVTTPRVWIAGGHETVCIVSHALISEVLCDIQLQESSNRVNLYVQKNVTLASGGSICVELPVPQNISAPSAELLVTATSLNSSIEYYSFAESAEIRIQRPTQITFIETDKPIYKPGDLVRIRILTLIGPDLSMLKEDILLAYIEDPSETRVMQWINVSTVNGIGSLEMQLSDEPRLGEWTIKASIKGQVPSQKFTVKEYVLPKFEVTIHHPSHLFSRSSEVKWKVCARYTYGQPVDGSVSSKICHHSNQNALSSACHSLNATKLQDGCLEFSVKSSDVNLALSSDSKIAVAKFFAEVEERGTGVKLNSTLTANISPYSLQLKLIPEDPGQYYFKPGLPYYGQVQVTRLDGMPVARRTVRIETDFLVFNTTTDKNGNFKYFLPGRITRRNMNSIQIHVGRDSPRVLVEDMEFQLSEPYEAVSRTLKAWYSRSGSFVQIEPFDGIASCRSSLSLPAVFVTKKWSNSNLTFYFQLMTRGDIVYAGQVTASPTSDNGLLKFNVTFDVTPRMSGSLKVLVFTILPNGETVADSMLITVETCFHNQVSISFAHQQKQPGHSTTLRLLADPHSLCSISVVDKSVQLMNKGDSSLSKDKVFEMLKQYDIPEDHYQQSGIFILNRDCGTITQPPDVPPVSRRRLPHGGGPRIGRSSRRRPGHLNMGQREFVRSGIMQSDYVDSKKSFMDAGMIFLSDLAVVTRPCSRQGYYRDRVLPHREYAMRRFLLNGMSMINIKRNSFSDDSVERDSIHFDSAERNSFPPDSAERSSFPPDSAEEMPILHRTFFPESWLWQLASVGDSGKDDINLNLPHTITEWIGNGFCTNVQSGLGVASPFSINAFQPFFLSFTLPYSMIRGERVGIPVSVFNYMNQCLKVFIELIGIRGLPFFRSRVILKIKHSKYFAMVAFLCSNRCNMVSLKALSLSLYYFFYISMIFPVLLNFSTLYCLLMTPMFFSVINC